MLETLDLAYNKLSGSVPSSIFNISSLQQIAMGDNNLVAHLSSNMFDYLPRVFFLDLTKPTLRITDPTPVRASSELRHPIHFLPIWGSDIVITDCQTSSIVRSAQFREPVITGSGGVAERTWYLLDCPDLLLMCSPDQADKLKQLHAWPFRQGVYLHAWPVRQGLSTSTFSSHTLVSTSSARPQASAQTPARTRKHPLSEKPTVLEFSSHFYKETRTSALQGCNIGSRSATSPPPASSQVNLSDFSCTPLCDFCGFWHKAKPTLRITDPTPVRASSELRHPIHFLPIWGSDIVITDCQTSSIVRSAQFRESVITGSGAVAERTWYLLDCPDLLLRYPVDCPCSGTGGSTRIL
ncbi:hypothetical protein GQ457_02G039250 [Hibiscus cannabinus]